MFFLLGEEGKRSTRRETFRSEDENSLFQAPRAGERDENEGGGVEKERGLLFNPSPSFSSLSPARGAWNRLGRESTTKLLLTTPLLLRLSTVSPMFRFPNIGVNGRSLRSNFSEHHTKHTQLHSWVSCGPTFQLDGL